MKKRIVVNSNGMGKQSKTVPILLYEKHPKMRKYWENTIILNVFADTHDETEEIYSDLLEYQNYLKNNNYPPLIIVSRGSLSKEYYDKSIIPTRSFRHCTEKFKIRIIRKFIKNWLKENNFVLKEVEIIMLIGITKDESHRIRDSDVKYITNAFPLTYEMNWSRNDCEKYLESKGLSANKSGCWYCPFLSFKRFYEYIKDKPDKKQLIKDWELRARNRNTKMMFFDYPIENLLKTKDSQKTLTGFIDSDIDFYSKEESCDSGYCFI